MDAQTIQVEKEFQGNITQSTTNICTRKSRGWQKASALCRIIFSQLILKETGATSKENEFLIKVKLKDCNVNKAYSYRLIVQQNREDRQVVTLARGHVRVRFTFYAHAAACVPHSL